MSTLGLQHHLLLPPPVPPLMLRAFTASMPPSPPPPPSSSSAHRSSSKVPPDPRPRVLVISGPTAVGKSSLALELAKRLGGEIISADSVQVYKELDVGSAKTPLRDRQGIPHHLIDIVHPLEEYDVGEFFLHSREATEQVLAKRKVPILVGGTGMYLRWYLYGKPDTPKSNPESMALVDEELLKCDGDWDKAVKLLIDSGDTNALTITRNDWFRLRRSLEIIKVSGLPRHAYGTLYYTKEEESQLSVSSRNLGTPRHKPADDVELDYHFMCFFMYNPRATLYRLIDQRCEDMLAGNMGLLQEASWLLDLGTLPNTSPASRAIGYRQAMEYLLQCRRADGLSSSEDFLSFLFQFQKASRNYAKRQLTWFRQEPLYHWLDASQPLDDIVNFLVNAYTEPATMATSEAVLLDKDVLMQKEDRREERKDLKAYKTRNRHFATHKDCSQVLEWIKKTQSGKR